MTPFKLSFTTPYTHIERVCVAGVCVVQRVHGRAPVCVRVGRKCILVARTARRGKLDIIVAASHRRDSVHSILRYYELFIEEFPFLFVLQY